ncbi:hypothetical protein PJV92_10170 [Aliarcobacter butzleri]|uniref:Uncharacterized protein n=1 Tax=Aliarcobacter butzleri TaxID=28197 RepID=A0AAP4UZG1_9BACT|nr:hypothetical protein [Aliarcobacter butzleri]MDN5052911.1 hypothetical protein [Aliarcobacter butzleri]MDN5075812.1 hypothetical protein [Aliarcobacter butzleri]MDN5117276.1 hypothetical protein [Aliarcobacter butzleri]MDN5133086.1 hypothetical protein [Aliarcobacter butzleri]
MRDKSKLSIEIQLEDDDINVISTSPVDLILNPKDKTLLLIALHQLKEKIENNKLDIEVLKC